MALRAPSVDNLIHWQYTLECPDTVFDLTGLSTRLEVRAYAVRGCTSDWEQLEAALQAEIGANRRAIEETKNNFEKWRLFLNPYRRLSHIVDRYEQSLRKIEVPGVQSPPIPATPEGAQRFHREMAEAVGLCEEAMRLSVTLDMVVPVMGEAAVNFVLLVLAKREIRNDQRMREDFSRRPIDVRVKSLHLLCNGFRQPITGSEAEFKAFLRVMGERNDALHGNIDPRKAVGELIFFDLRTIPLLGSQRSFGQVALENALSSISPKTTLEKVDVVRAFVEFLLCRLETECRTAVEQAMAAMHLGYCAETGTIGVILPAAQVEGFPVVEKDQGGGEWS
jgi:hypothetical protein